MTTATERCPANTFTGSHVPLAPGSVRCRKCGGVIAGELAKLEGTQRALSAVWNTYGEYADAFTTELRRIAATGRRFTSEDITDLVGFYRTPGTNRNNGVGAFMLAAATQGLIRQVATTHSRNERQHGASLAVWVGA